MSEWAEVATAVSRAAFACVAIALIELSATPAIAPAVATATSTAALILNAKDRSRQGRAVVAVDEGRTAVTPDMFAPSSRRTRRGIGPRGAIERQ
jgi:hypothetical protein